ncbi:MAG: hypothetical protein ACTSPV_01530 [Candidatus Hodarchaeales archaeon]
MIEKINFVSIFEFETENEAKTIQVALKPDNLASPPVKINSVVNDKKMKKKKKNNVKIETVLVTIIDIILATELVESIIKINREN